MGFARLLGRRRYLPPFSVETSEAEVQALRQRVADTRWPDRETVPDHSQGVQLDTIQELARYWASDYDLRRCEAKLNALPQFNTEIDGLDIHFIHVRSAHDNALPLILTHGWPGSVIELLKVINPLTNPTAHGANASDAFHVVIPSMPGYGYSDKPGAPGWGPELGRASLPQPDPLQRARQGRGTLRPGNSPSSFPRRFARRSGHCARSPPPYSGRCPRSAAPLSG